jgi:hypothetical protein
MNDTKKHCLLIVVEILPVFNLQLESEPDNPVIGVINEDLRTMNRWKIESGKIEF